MANTVKITKIRRLTKEITRYQVGFWVTGPSLRREPCVVGKQVMVGIQDSSCKEQVGKILMTSTITHVEPIGKNGDAWEVETRNSLYHVEKL